MQLERVFPQAQSPTPPKGQALLPICDRLLGIFEIKATHIGSILYLSVSVKKNTSKITAIYFDAYPKDKM